MIKKESEEKMKVKVNEDKCMGCGSCVAITKNEIFDFNDDGKACAIKKEINEQEEINEAKEAIEYCPTHAIEEE